jgi:hypothetical protein
MAQPGPSDYRYHQSPDDLHRHSEVVMDQISETARDFGDRAGSLTEDVGAAIKHRPYTTLAIAAGLAFAAGALWKLNRRQPRSRLDGLRSQLPPMPTTQDLQNLLPARWR